MTSSLFNSRHALGCLALPMLLCLGGCDELGPCCGVEAPDVYRVVIGERADEGLRLNSRSCGQRASVASGDVLVFKVLQTQELPHGTCIAPTVIALQPGTTGQAAAHVGQAVSAGPGGAPGWPSGWFSAAFGLGTVGPDSWLVWVSGKSCPAGTGPALVVSANRISSSNCEDSWHAEVMRVED